MRQYFSEWYEGSGENVKVKFDLSHYATKAHMK